MHVCLGIAQHNTRSILYVAPEPPPAKPSPKFHPSNEKLRHPHYFSVVKLIHYRFRLVSSGTPFIPVLAPATTITPDYTVARGDSVAVEIHILVSTVEVGSEDTGEVHSEATLEV